MRLKDICNWGINKSNNQINIYPKRIILKKIGMTEEQFLNLKLPKNFKLPKDIGIKFIKKKK